MNTKPLSENNYIEMCRFNYIEWTNMLIAEIESTRHETIPVKFILSADRKTKDKELDLLHQYKWISPEEPVNFQR